MENDLEKADDSLVIEGELVADELNKIQLHQEEDKTKNGKTIIKPTDKKVSSPKKTKKTPPPPNTKYFFHYILLPVLFLTVTLLGGLRIGAENSEFVFFRPPLICLIFAAILVVLIFRANLIESSGWFSEDFSTAKNIANGLILFTLFSASTQVFNALIPEQGLPFWVVSFCFFWTLWTNLFAEFDTRRLLQSLGGLFGIAFIAKYLILVNMVAGETESWWEFLSPKQISQEVFTYLLDLPNYTSGTGYIQFFTLVFFLLGLILIKPKTA